MPSVGYLREIQMAQTRDLLELVVIISHLDFHLGLNNALNLSRKPAFKH